MLRWRVIARRIAVVVTPLLVLVLVAPARAADLGAHVRRDASGLGLFLPGNLWISGDVTLAVDVPETEPASAEVDDLSLLARWEPLGRLAFFGELRVEDPFEVVEGEGIVHEGREVLLERLYAEVIVSPAVSLRIGKVFTPFGLWNVVTRAPLTWTLEEPAVVENVFPQRATGLSLLFRKSWRAWSFDATVYGPAQNEIQFRSTDDEGLDAGLLFGGRVVASRSFGEAYAAVGLNAAGFRSHDGSRPWATATGIDLELSVAGHELTGELTYRVPTTGGRTEHGLYLQDAIPLIGPLHGVLRFEYFRPRRGPAAVGQLVGLFYRPLPNLILKADYLFATRRLENLEPGFRASVSVLF